MWVSKASNVTRGFQKTPLEGFNLERSQCYALLILLLQFGDNQAAEYFSFSSCLDWRCTVLLKVSLQTYPLAEINKVIIE